eukprot:11833317-Ditylum_brightwellii.AAC.1
MDPDNPWGSMLSAVIFALQPTTYTTHKATPMQLVFGRDGMLNVMHLANWHYIQEQETHLIKKHNKQENVKCKRHEYHVNDKVMIKNNQKLKYGTNTYIRLYQIAKVHTSSTVCVKS